MYTMAPIVQRDFYARPGYRKPERKIWLVKGQEEREYYTRDETALSEISDWVGTVIDSRRFTDTDTGEILVWRVLRRNRKYYPKAHRSAPLKVMANKLEPDITIDFEGNLDTQWNALARKFEVGAPFVLFKHEQKIQPQGVRWRDQIEIRPLCDTTIMVKNETENRTIHFEKANESQLRAKVQSLVKGGVLYQNNRRIQWSQVEDGMTYRAMEPSRVPSIKGRFHYGGEDRVIEYRNSRGAWLQFQEWAGRDLMIIEEGTEKTIEPTEVTSDSSCYLLPKRKSPEHQPLLGRWLL